MILPSMDFLNLFVWESRYPIFSRLCDFLAIGDIVALTRTCRQFANLYQLLLPSNGIWTDVSGVSFATLPA